MKKIIILILCLFSLFTLFACDEKKKSKAAADRKTLLDEAFDNAIENFKTAHSTHTALDGESVIFVYDPDSRIK